jgi:hypothetical protein
MSHTEVWIVKDLLIKIDYCYPWYCSTTTIFYIHSYYIISPINMDKINENVLRYVLLVLNHISKNLVLYMGILYSLIHNSSVLNSSIRSEIRDRVIPIFKAWTQSPWTIASTTFSSVLELIGTIKLVLWSETSIEFIIHAIHEHPISHTLEPVVP